MTTIRRFTCDDMLRFNNVNLDVLTETARLAVPVARAAHSGAVRAHLLPAVPGQVARVLPLRGGAGRRLPGLQCALPSCTELAHSPRAVMGKVEGGGENWHGHVSAVTARQAAACSLSGSLSRLPGGARVPATRAGRKAHGPAGGDDGETVCSTAHAAPAHAAPAPSHAYRRSHNGYFVDLFVRKSNAVAIGMYEKVGALQRPPSTLTPRSLDTPSTAAC